MILGASARRCSSAQDCGSLESCLNGYCQAQTLRGGDVVTLQDQVYANFMKPVFGCIATGGHTVCMNDASVTDYPQLYQWRVVQIRPDRNIVAFQNVLLGTFLTANPTSGVIEADSQDSLSPTTHWKVHNLADRTILLQHFPSGKFLTVGSMDSLRVLTLKPYDLNPKTFAWTFTKFNSDYPGYHGPDIILHSGSHPGPHPVSNSRKKLGEQCSLQTDCEPGLICLGGRCKSP